MPAWDWVMLVVGTAIGALSLTADVIGLGGFPGFGWKQAVGTALALILVACGAIRIVRRDPDGRP